MAFLSLKFIAFFALVLAVYYFLPARGQPLFLLLASWTFYALQSGALLALLVLATIISFGAAIAMERRALSHRKLWLWLGCLFCFGLLFFYKYFDFFLSPVLRFTHWTLPESFTRLAVPAGLSFFTFSITGYLFDVYRGKCPAEKSFVHYAVFTAFFPAILAGPVGKAREFLPQLRERHAFAFPAVKAGALRFAFGALEKLAVADVIAIAVNNAYGGESPVSGGMWLAVALLYSLQIYFDFAGYSHMALGAAEALGLSLTENFSAPYYSASVRAFWKKWHISLTSWFREYLYFPLGGSRKGRGRTYFNILVVFAVSGLWHGAAMTYVCWGALNGVLQIIEMVLQPVTERLDRRTEHRALGVLRLCLKTALTYVLISATWVFFRSESFSQAAFIGGQIAGLVRYGFGAQTLADLGLTLRQQAALALMLVFCGGVDALSLRGSVRERLSRTLVPYYLALFALIAAACVLGAYGSGFTAQEFVYFRY